MDCREARKILEDSGSGEQAAGARLHLDECPECRRYLRQTQALLAGLDYLRRTSETLEPRRYTIRRWPVWIKAAAAIFLVIGVTLFFSVGRKSATVPQDKPVAAANSPQLVLSRESSERYLVMAPLSGHPNVRLYVLYPTVQSRQENN